MLQYREKLTGVDWMSLNVTERNVDMDNLTPDTSYLFQVAAVNFNGSGPYANITVKTFPCTTCDDHQNTNETTAKQMWSSYVVAAVVSAAGIFAVALCIVVAVTACYFRYR